MQTELVHSSWHHESFAHDKGVIESLLTDNDFLKIPTGTSQEDVAKIKALIEKKAAEVHYVLKTMEAHDGQFHVLLSEVNNDAEDIWFTFPCYATVREHYEHQFTQIGSVINPGRGAYWNSKYIVDKNYKTQVGQVFTDKTEHENITHLIGIDDQAPCWQFTLLSYGSDKIASYIDIKMNTTWGSEKKIRIYDQ